MGSFEERDPIAAMEAWLRWLSHEATAPPGQHDVDLAIALLENAQVSVVVLDGSARIVHANRFFEHVSGYRLDEMRGRAWQRLLAPDRDHDALAERVRGAIEGDAMRGFVSPIRTKDGRERVLEWHDRRLREERGETMALLVIGHDITERLAAVEALERLNLELEARVAERSRELADANRALEENQRRLRAIVENTTDGMVFVDRDWRFRYLNPAAERVLGLDHEAVLGRRIVDVFPDAETSPTFRALSSVPADGRSIEWDSDAPLAGRWLAGTASPAGDGLVVVFRDVTEQRRAQKMLRESEARLREAQEIAQLGSWTLDLRSGELEWSDEIFRIFEQERGSFGGTYEHFLSLVHPDDRERVDAEYRRSVEQHTLYDYVHRLLLPDGRIKHVRERGRTDYDRSGAPVRSVGTVQDVSREVLAERSLAIKHAAMESSLNAIAIAELDGRISYVNAAFVALWKLDGRNEALGRKADSFWFDPEAARKVIEKVQREGAWSGQLVAERTDGELRTLDVSAHLVRDATGQPDCFMGSFVDVTARVAAEREAQRAAEGLTIFKQLTESANQPIGVGGRDGRGIYLNQAMRELFEIPPELAASEVSVHEFYSPETMAWVDREIVPRVATGESWSGEVEIRTLSGRVKRTIHHTFVVHGLQGEPVGIANAITDITDRTEAERRLARSEAQLRAVFQQVAVGMVLTDLDARILRANERFYEIATRPRDSLVGVCLWDLVSENDFARGDALRRQVASGALESYTVQVRLRLHDGTERWVEVAVSPRVEDGRPVELLWALQDITARVEAELELRRSQEILVRAETLARLASWEWNLRTGELRGSPELLRQLGQHPAQGSVSPELALARIHPEDLERVWAYAEAVMATGDAPPIEYRIVGEDGEVRMIRCEASRAVSEGQGSRVLYGFSQDVTEKKAAEDRIAAQLREKEVLLREIHHRVKNNLQVISSLLYFQSIRCEEPKVAQLFDESRNRVRAMALVHETLYESRDLGKVEFRTYAENLTRGLIASYATGCRVRYVITGEAALDIEDAVPCALITSELVTNALKYAFEGRGEGTIRVSLERTGGGRLRLSVADDGVGMDACARGDGSLGLRLVRALADQLTGDLEIRSVAGSTELAVTFPVRQTEAPPPCDAR